MRFLSPLLKSVVYPGLARAGYFQRRPLSGNLCVVTYHGVLPEGYQSEDAALDGSLITGGSLRAQVRLLKSRYNLLSPEEALPYLESGAEFPARSVLLTCDDGLQNVLTEMVPILRDEGVSCLFFVTGASAEDTASMLWYEELYLMLKAAPAGALAFPELKLSAQLADQSQRRPLWWSWVNELSKHDAGVRQSFMETLREHCELRKSWKSRYEEGAARQRFYQMTARELRELAQTGMAMGAHTMSHPVLAGSSPELVWQEMTKSREALAGVLGKPVWAMAYPFGDPASVGPREFALAERAGYKCAFVNSGGGFCDHFSQFTIPRVHVTADMGLGEFEAHISGFHDALRRRFGRQDAKPCA
jgi:peptidoglycan/xylan/chitin deacetylase (PgdA/CDA1 family)